MNPPGSDGRAAAAPVHRYICLDSLRGICAVVVSLYHFNRFAIDHVYVPMTYVTQNYFVTNGYLLVDFFFVLSGFIISTKYRAELAKGLRAVDFMFLRIGRLYPLHAVVLIIVAILFPILLPKSVSALHHRGLSDFISTALLINSTGGNHLADWNTPSWSISAEIWMYLCFCALVKVYFVKDSIKFSLMALLCLGILTIFSKNGIDTTYDFGFIRCAYGFSLGVLVSIFFDILKIRSSNFLELIITAIAIAAVSFGSKYVHLGVPIIFAFFVAVYAKETGLISKILKNKILVSLGNRSYSYYLIHYILIIFYAGLLKYLKVFANSCVNACRFGHQYVLSTVEDVILTAIPVIVTYWLAGYFLKFVEIPSHKWARKMVSGRMRSHKHLARA